jgi:hypothetical protein
VLLTKQAVLLKSFDQNSAIGNITSAIPERPKENGQLHLSCLISVTARSEVLRAGLKSPQIF